MIAVSLAVACAPESHAGDDVEEAAPAMVPESGLAGARQSPSSSAAPAETAPEARETLVVVAGGDVSLGRDQGQRLLRRPEHDPLAAVRGLYHQADLAFVNLESPLTDQNGETRSPRSDLIFCGPPIGARVLARAGIDLVSLANNHAWDYGRNGLVETLRHLEKWKLQSVGVSAQSGRAYAARTIQARGWSIAVLAFTEIWNQGPLAEHAARAYVAEARSELACDAITQAREQHDLVWVSYHGGSEYIEYPLVSTRKFMRAVVQCGADAVFGHHPHVPHGIGWIDGKPIFYSLGNLVFPQHREHKWTGYGLSARLTYAPSGQFETQACPHRLINGEPRPVSGPAREILLRRLQQRLDYLSVTVGGSMVGVADVEGCFPLAPRAAAVRVDGAGERHGSKNGLLRRSVTR